MESWSVNTIRGDQVAARAKPRPGAFSPWQESYTLQEMTEADAALISWACYDTSFSPG